MTDKVQKIRNYACELLKDSQNGFGSASYNILKMVIAYIDSLPEEPVSEDLDIAIGEYCSNPDNFITYIDVAFAYRSEQKDDIPLIIKAIKFGAKWGKNQAMAEIQAQSMALAYGCPKELVSEDLENASDDYATKLVNKTTEFGVMDAVAFDGYCIMDAFKDGAKWQLERVNEALLSEVLPCFMHGGEADEVVAKLDEVLNKKK